MTMELPAGTYTVTVANNGYGGSTGAYDRGGRTETLDLNTLKGAGPKFGNILFAVDVEGALIQIDGKVVDTEEAVPISMECTVLRSRRQGTIPLIRNYLLILRRQRS